MNSLQRNSGAITTPAWSSVSRGGAGVMAFTTARVRVALFLIVSVVVVDCLVPMRMALLDDMGATLGKKLGRELKLVPGPGATGGGGGAMVGSVEDETTGERWFYKSCGFAGEAMLRAEFKGLRAMSETNTIRVPKPIVVGTNEMGTSVFALFEYLAMGYPKNDDTAREFGRQLAKMHRATSDNGQHGFAIPNTIGATHQPNDWTESWSEFFVEKRLKHMLRLCRRDGATFPHEAECIEKCRRILSEHEQEHSVAPSLVHGDLWSGNTGATADGTPCIFDPATYYGDRETDVAMTTLFGRQADAFYEGYEEENPLPEGFWEERKVIYNLYHVLNHYVLFGGGYLAQAQSMMGTILMDDTR